MMSLIKVFYPFPALFLLFISVSSLSPPDQTRPIIVKSIINNGTLTFSVSTSKKFSIEHPKFLIQAKSYLTSGNINDSVQANQKILTCSNIISSTQNFYKIQVIILNQSEKSFVEDCHFTNTTYIQLLTNTLNSDEIWVDIISLTLNILKTQRKISVSFYNEYDLVYSKNNNKIKKTNSNRFLDSCSEYCTVCLNSTTCQECETGFYLSQSHTCEYCKIPQCDICDDSNFCEKCSQGFYFDKNKLVCFPCTIKGCLSCENSTFCSSCNNDGYYLTDINLCQDCHISCKSCSDAFSCIECEMGYYSSLTSQICLKCSTPNCDHCPNDTCLTCSLSYFHTSFKCVACPNHCLICQNPLTCKTCQIGFSLTPHNLCSPCPDNCEICDLISSTPECFICTEGYYLSNDQKLCLPCNYNCDSCLEYNLCFSCFHGYYYDIDKCVRCPYGCWGCEGQNWCLGCDEGFFWENGKCFRCSEACEKCLSTGCYECKIGFYIEDGVKRCRQCIEGCLKCNGDDSCETCEERFFLDGLAKVCWKLSKGCKTGLLKGNSLICTDCLDKYELIETECVECFSINCSKCFQSKCINCEKGYFLSDQNCEMCKKGCSGCDSQTCQTCDLGYFLNNNQYCNNCPNGCNYCVKNNFEYCTECKSGFFLTFKGYCEKCDPTCFTCENQHCSEYCNIRSFKDSSNGLCVKCDYYCKACDKDNCLICDDGAFHDYVEKKCIFPCDIRCDECFDGKCARCKPGFYLDNEMRYCKRCAPGCYECNEDGCIQCFNQTLFDENLKACKFCPENCEICGVSSCEKCKYSYFYNYSSGSCDRCSENCVECSSYTNCFLCQDPYLVDTNGFCIFSCSSKCEICSKSICSKCTQSFYLNNQECRSCSDNCKSCINSTKCEICNDKYTLVNYQCLICTPSKVLSSEFSTDFQSILLKFSHSFTISHEITCENVLITNANLGKSPKCLLNNTELLIKFGPGYYFTNSTGFQINLQSLYVFLCNNTKTSELLFASFIINPPVPSLVITGIKKLSKKCESRNLKYKLGSIQGNLNQDLLVSWTAKFNPENPEALEYIQSIKDTTLQLELKYFTQDTDISLTVDYSNCIGQGNSSSFFTKIMSTKHLSVNIYPENYLTVQVSKTITLFSNLTDQCYAYGIPSYTWSCKGISDNSFIYSPNRTGYYLDYKFRIPQWTFISGNVYNCSVKVQLESFNNKNESEIVEGSDFVVLYTQITPIVIVLDKVNGTIGTNSNYTINATKSFDPDKQLSEQNLLFNWKCSIVNIGPCSDLLFPNTSSSVVSLDSEKLVAFRQIIVELEVKDKFRLKYQKEILMLEIVEGLSIEINIENTNKKIETSEVYLIKGKISSHLPGIFSWKIQHQDFSSIISSTSPNFLILPNTLSRSSVYTLTLTISTSSNSLLSISQLSFISNSDPNCQETLTLSKDSGYSLSTEFKFSIFSCTDKDQDYPLTYTFGILNKTNEPKMPYLISSQQLINSIKTKLFEGEFLAFVRVCDQLFGCSIDSKNMNVLKNPQPVENILTQYLKDTTFPQLIPIYAVGYYKMYEMDDLTNQFIFNDLELFIRKNGEFNKESCEIIVGVLNELFNELQSKYLSYEKIKKYFQVLVEIINNSVNGINEDTLENVFHLLFSSLKYGNKRLEHILMVSELWKSVLIGVHKINYIGKSLFFTDYFGISHKYYDEVESIAGKILRLNEEIQVNIQYLTLEPTDLLSILINVYTDNSGISPILDISFAVYGKQLGQNIEYSQKEQSLYLDKCELIISLPIYYKTDQEIDCACLNGTNWVFDCCSDIKKNGSLYYFTLDKPSIVSLVHKKSSLVSEASDQFIYGPLVLQFSILSIFVMVLPLLFVFEKNENLHFENGPNSRPWFTYALIFSLILDNKWQRRSSKLIWLLVIFNLQLIIEGILRAKSFKVVNGQTQQVIDGMIACLITISISLYSVIHKKIIRTYLRIAEFLAGFILILACFIVTFIIVTKEILEKSEYKLWTLSFLSGILIETSMELLIFGFSIIVYRFVNMRREKRRSQKALSISDTINLNIERQKSDLEVTVNEENSCIRENKKGKF